MRTAVSILVFLMPLGALAAQSGLADLRRAFQRSDDPGDRLEARRRTLAAVAAADEDSAALARALLVAYENVEAEALDVENRRRRLLVRGGGRPLVLHNQELDPLRALQTALLDRMRALKDPTARLELFERAIAERKLPFALRYEVCRLAGGTGREGVAALVAAAAKARQPADIACALAAAEGLGADAQPIGAAVLSWLAHDSADLREAAARALAAMCWPASIEPLIERLEHEEGRTQRRVAEALETLTRQRLGTATASWLAWLAAEGDPYLHGDVALGGGTPDRDATSADRGYFYGLPLTGKSILFLFDRSNSMRAKVGGRDAPADSPTRLEEAKSELQKSLDQLHEDTRFGIITFARELTRFDERLLPATKTNAERAKAWVRDQRPQFATNTYDALELAFVTAGRGTHDRYYECDVDAIYLLTDGRPTIDNGQGRGASADDPARILAAVRRWNALDRVTIHTVGLGRDIGKAFLEKLAAQNDGRFVHHR